MGRELVGYDITEDANDPQAVCLNCYASPGEYDDAPPLYTDDEWGGTECLCDSCGDEINVTVVEPR